MGNADAGLIDLTGRRMDGMIIAVARARRDDPDPDAISETSYGYDVR
jgi:hypothetical protein